VVTMRSENIISYVNNLLSITYLPLAALAPDASPKLMSHNAIPMTRLYPGGAGLATIKALPRLVLHTIYRNHGEQRSDTDLLGPHCLEDSYRLRGGIEGTQYRSARPLGWDTQGRQCSVARLAKLIGFKEHCHKVCGEILSYSPKIRPSIYQAKILPEQGSLNSLFDCLVSGAERSFHFLPAFIFYILPRGPPQTGLRECFAGMDSVFKYVLGFCSDEHFKRNFFRHMK
jgi:hypothetical protein